jgi:RluA family pseudouridine synthase
MVHKRTSCLNPDMNSKSHCDLMPLTIYEDQDLMIVNKPAGLLSLPDGFNPDLAHLRSLLEPRFGALWIVHRLDRETSGLVILAKNEISHRELNKQFRERQVKKTYHALVTPQPNFQEETLHLPLRPNADRKHRTRVDHQNGKEAQSALKVLKRFHLGALMEVRITSGITHQIRAHLRSLDLCLIGETLYSAGLPPQPLNASRAMLHARQVAFSHPITGEELIFEAPYPEDFRETYTELRFTKAQDGSL